MKLSADLVKRKARECGFDLCGIARATDHPELGSFERWLARGFAGRMEYLARSAARRADVRRVLPAARSVICLGTIYDVDRPYSTEIADPAEALVARYAWGDDYHVVVGRRLEALVSSLREASDEAFEARSYVDTGHVQERVYARHAGLGWIGKNTCLINPDLGSWLFLSEILCSLDLEPDEPGLDRCGTCALCLEACPTGALVEPGVMDARRCISYLTIELKGAIPQEWRSAIGSHVYGCDVCQEVCPWNQASARSTDPAWQPRPALDRQRVADLAALADEDLRSAIRRSAMRRAGVAGLRRNIAIALENVRHAGRDDP